MPSPVGHLKVYVRHCPAPDFLVNRIFRHQSVLVKAHKPLAVQVSTSLVGSGLYIEQPQVLIPTAGSVCVTRGEGNMENAPKWGQKKKNLFKNMKWEG